MLLIPLLAWVPIFTSVLMLAAFAAAGDLRARTGVALFAWFAAAAWAQFFGGSAVVSAIGLTFQSLLGICLIVRWHLSS